MSSLFTVQCELAYNGPAVAGVSVTRRSHPATGPGSRQLAGRKCVPVASRVWHVFLQSGYRVTLMLAGSRYNFSNWQVISPGIVVL
jgi:hypothetical protein